MKKVIVSTLILSLLLAFMPVHLMALDSGTATIEVIKGPVQYKASSESKWTDISGNTEFSAGQYVNVGPGGSALVNFPDGSTIRLYENSMLRIWEIIDTGKVRNYSISFVGKIVVNTVKNTETGSTFNSNAPAVDVFSSGIEYTAELETDLFLKVNNINGDAQANEASKFEGKVKEVSLSENYFLLEIGKDKILKVRTYPHTIFFEKYKNYKKTGNPRDLGYISDVSKGETVTVFGVFDPTGRFFGVSDPENTIFHASLVTNRCFLPAAAFAVWGGVPTFTGMGITAGVIGVATAVIIGISVGGNDVSATRP